ncbi:MAG: sugar kinase [Bacteroidetes bacterium]|nr:sugar kinase [Bacteroidota bacterium]MBU1117037.1 sugar kinase [Bacteroidota bacterium]MBU1797632.1 sugar kinase [Bacteroidota bacterium]
MKKKIVTFGEIMLRLSTPGYSRFVQSSSYDSTYGGGEANVSVALSNYGTESFFVSKLPKHEIGQSAINSLRKYGVNTDFVVRGGERVGIYFLETGASQRPSKVIYDRANSAISLARAEEFNWEKIFEGKDWFHWTGITPALGSNAQLAVKEASIVAKRLGLKISCDLNFRQKMWTEKEAQAVMNPLMEYVDVCIANEEDAEKSLGMKLKGINIEKAELNENGYFSLAKELKSKYDFETVAITLRESFSASRNGWSALLHDNKDCKVPYRSKRYDIQIVDRVGGGDSFASGLIYGLLTKDSTKIALEFAVGASCLKQTIYGDFNLVSIDEVNKLISGNGSGRVER